MPAKVSTHGFCFSLVNASWSGSFYLPCYRKAVYEGKEIVPTAIVPALYLCYLRSVLYIATWFVLLVRFLNMVLFWLTVAPCERERERERERGGGLGILKKIVSNLSFLSVCVALIILTILPLTGA